MADGRRRQKTAHERGFDVLRRDWTGKSGKRQEVSGIGAVCLLSRRKGGAGICGAGQDVAGEFLRSYVMRFRTTAAQESSARMPELAIV
jgi:hypothetical protein